MPIVLNTAPINVKDSDGNYVTLNSFSMDSLNSIKNQTENSLTEIEEGATNAVNTIEEAASEAIDNIDDAKEAGISDIRNAAALEVPKMLVIEEIEYSGSTITKYASEITENMYVINYFVNKPHIAPNLKITTSNGSITIEGDIINNDNIKLTIFLFPCQITTLNDQSI